MSNWGANLCLWTGRSRLVCRIWKYRCEWGWAVKGLTSESSATEACFAVVWRRLKPAKEEFMAGASAPKPFLVSGSYMWAR